MDAINVIEMALHSIEQHGHSSGGIHGNGDGLSQSRLFAIRDWWRVHPLCRKLMELSRELLNKLANSRMGRPQVKPPLHASSVRLIELLYFSTNDIDLTLIFLHRDLYVLQLEVQHTLCLGNALTAMCSVNMSQKNGIS